MKKVTLNLLPARGRRELHAYLSETLSFPEYYGHNLDALHDCLTDISEDTAICILEAPYRDDSYVRSLNRVFLDAEEENRHLAVFIVYPAVL